MRGIHRSQTANLELAEDFAAALDTLSAQGRAVVSAWLQHAPSWRRPMYLVLTDLQEREGVKVEGLPAPEDEALLPAPPRDVLADAVVSVFSSGVFRDEVVPQVRAWLLKDGPEVGDFVACFTALARWTSQEHAKDPQLSPAIRLTRAALRHLSASTSSEVGQATASAVTLLRSLYRPFLPPLDHAPLSSAEWLLSLHAYYLATVTQISLPLSARCHPQFEDFELL